MSGSEKYLCGFALTALLLSACARQGTVSSPISDPRPEVESSGPLEIKGDVKVPVAIHRVEPSRPLGITETGQVIMQTVIGLDGTAHDIHVIKTPHPKLSEVSIEALKGWRFRPGTLHGRPVETIFYVQITFH
jgi:hypothetical protein